MGLETPTYVQDFVTSNPDGTDPKSQGDNHIRNMKTALKNTFPGATRAFYFDASKSAQTGVVNVVAADASKLFPCNAAGGAMTINFPANATIYDGFRIRVVKVDSSANTVTIDGNGSDPINGGLTVVIGQQYQAYDLEWCSGISSWIAYRADSNSVVDSSLTFVSNVLGRAALTGAISAAAGSNATTETIDLIIVIGDGVSTITTGVKGYVPFDFAATITGWTLLADASGSIVIDVWKDTYANYPPTVADTIAGSEKPTLSSVIKNQDLSLSTWTTAIASGDVLGFNVDSITTCKQVTLALKLTKTS